MRSLIATKKHLKQKERINAWQNQKKKTIHCTITLTDSQWVFINREITGGPFISVSEFIRYIVNLYMDEKIPVVLRGDSHLKGKEWWYTDRKLQEKEALENMAKYEVEQGVFADMEHKGYQSFRDYLLGEFDEESQQTLERIKKAKKKKSK